MLHRQIAYFLATICFPSIAMAAEQTYIREYVYQASEADSKLTARAIALQEVKRELLSELGTHVTALVKIQSSSDGTHLGTEEIETLAAGVTRVEVLDEKWNGTVYVLKAQIKADPADVLMSLNKMLDADKKQKQISQLDGELSKMRNENIQIAESLTQAKKETTAVLTEIARLRIQLEEQQSVTARQTLQAAYQQQVDQLSLNELVDSALKYYGEGNYPAAYRLFHKAAVQGNAIAQYHLGLMYRFGKGVTRNEKLAVHWYNKAALQGNSDGQVFLGLMYANGYGVTEDSAQAVSWYTKSAEQGNVLAQYLLGNMYNLGSGVTQDYVKSHEWYLKAAMQGDADAQHSVGYDYAFGQGVNKDYAEAIMWFQKSARQGNADGQSSLGFMYQIGFGVPQDYLKALEWYRKAAKQGDAGAQISLGEMYEDGKGVPQDYSTALEWYRKALKNANPYLKPSARFHISHIKKLTQSMAIKQP